VKPKTKAVGAADVRRTLVATTLIILASLACLVLADGKKLYPQVFAPEETAYRQAVHDATRKFGLARGLYQMIQERDAACQGERKGRHPTSV
jgi:hypothetical protein